MSCGSTQYSDVIRSINKFPLGVRDVLKCLICRNVLLDARQTPCGCKFCGKCIESYLGNGRKMCPGQKSDCVEINMAVISTDVNSDTEISRLFAECPYNNCSYRCQIRKLHNHMRTCACAPEQCVFASIECCQSIVSADQMQKHLDEFSVVHLKALVAHVRNIEDEIKQLTNHYKMALESLENDNVALKDKLQDVTEVLRLRLDKCEERQATTEAKMHQIFQDNMVEIARMKEYFKQILSTHANDERKSETLPLHSLKYLFDGNTEVLTQGDAKSKMDTLTGQSDFLWRIDEITKKYFSPYDEYSDPFYSDVTSGYKMCLYCRLNSDGLRLTFHLMLGENDSQLRWPMERTVLIELMDELNEVPVLWRYVCRATVADRNRAQDRIKAYDKPTRIRNDFGDGFVDCVNYWQIKSTPGGIRNDTMTVRCCVLPD